MSEEIKSAMKICQFCAREIPSHALKCRYCNEWVHKQAAESTSAQSTKKRFSNALPVWHFILLSIITLGFYEICWFYRNWKHLKIHKNLDISPGWRTIGLFVPIYGIILVYRQLRNIRDFSQGAGVDTTYSPGWIFLGWFVITGLCQLPDPFWFLSLLSVCPLAVVQAVLNSYWAKEQPAMPSRTGFSGGQIVLLVIGGFLFVLALIVTFIPEQLNSIANTK
jgi:hypothetical protein